jgi:hypothetical protein
LTYFCPFLVLVSLLQWLKTFKYIMVTERLLRLGNTIASTILDVVKILIGCCRGYFLWKSSIFMPADLQNLLLWRTLKIWKAYSRAALGVFGMVRNDKSNPSMRIRNWMHTHTHTNAHTHNCTLCIQVTFGFLFAVIAYAFAVGGHVVQIALKHTHTHKERERERALGINSAP